MVCNLAFVGRRNMSSSHLPSDTEIVWAKMQPR